MLNLMLVTQKKILPIDKYLQFIESCITAGVTSVQLREKTLNTQQLLIFGGALLECLKPYDIPLIINDQVEVAKKLNAHGVHLGQTDGDPRLARSYLGADKIIGLSVSSMDELHTAQNLPIDYVGIGPVFPTSSKTDNPQHCGLDGLGRMVAASSFPSIAIGGIQKDNAAEVLGTGVDGVAVIGTLHTAKNIKATCQSLLNINLS